jgi:ubiquinone biosynthesis protein UbiJ
MDQLRVSEAVEAAAKALHESVRDQKQFRWDAMTEQWRIEMRAYVRPCVLAALRASDEFVARPTDRRGRATRPRLETVSR